MGATWGCNFAAATDGRYLLTANSTVPMEIVNFLLLCIIIINSKSQGEYKEEFVGTGCLLIKLRPAKCGCNFVAATN